MIFSPDEKTNYENVSGDEDNPDETDTVTLLSIGWSYAILTT